MRSGCLSKIKRRTYIAQDGPSTTFSPLKYHKAPCRQYHIDGRSRLSSVWAPSGGVVTANISNDNSHTLLLAAGFLRQAYSGVFHLLPLGLRVQEKIERLIDKHMQKLGASKVSLSSITSEALWKQSGRFDTNSNSELLRLNARSGPGFMLSPTHEEEITTLVAGSLKSYKELPIRLYQITRKYRDERRPRGGLLRTREFLMKDLYTFDLDDKAALGTYHNVKDAYDGIFQELKIKYLVAEADSGSMGGSYSHEFHFATPVGEDNVISCNECSYVANEELAERRLSSSASADAPVGVSTFISHDGFTLVKVHYGRVTDPKTGETIGLNIHALKKALPSLDIDFGVEEPEGKWRSNQASQAMLARDQSFTTTHVFDGTLAYRSQPLDGTMSPQSSATTTKILAHPQTGHPLDLTGISNGDNCPRCPTGQLSVQRAVELGHTFHLGTRYSEPLGAAVSIPGKEQKMALSMGCHGIGITRMIAAVASILADGKGLNWPRVIAPYEVVIVPRKGHEGDAEGVYDALIGAGRADAALDDRKLDFIWKLNDADRFGFPVVVVLGRAWKAQQKCEVQCRRLGNLKQEVALEDLPSFVAGLLSQL